MRFILNETDCLNLAALHCIYPNFDDPIKLKALLAYLNSDVCSQYMRLEKRTYGGGLDKFEPNDLNQILVIDIDKISNSILMRLANLFDKLCAAVKDKNEEALVKKAINNIIENILSTKA